jgi:oligogalacturonide lyase
MAKAPATNERIHRTDPQTGVEIIQLTSFPTMSMPFSYHRQNFTPDSKTMIFRSQRMPMRDARWDLYRVDADGSNMVRMTEGDGIRGAALSPDGKVVYLLRRGTLSRVGMDSCREEEVAHLDAIDPAKPYDVAVSNDGAHIFARTHRRDGAWAIAHFSADGKEAALISEGIPLGMLACDPCGRGLLVSGEHDGAPALLLMSAGGDVQFFTANVYAHSGWLGNTGRVQGCARWPRRALLSAGMGDMDPSVVAEGPYFWHSAATDDGEWIVADTNWPDEGIQLAHAASGRFQTLCFPGASEGHPQWTHPHPGWSPDGKLVYFSSDRTGICQAYLAKVPDEMKLGLAGGG